MHAEGRDRLSRKAFLRRLLAPAGAGLLLGGAARARGMGAGGLPGPEGRLPRAAAKDAEALLIDRAGRLWRESVGSLPLRTVQTGGTRTLAERFRETANLRDYGAEGEGRADDAAALRAALVAQDSDAVLLPRGVYRIGASLETAPGKALIFQPGARLAPDRGVDLTVRGPVESGSGRIFEGHGTVRLRGNAEIDARWFGASDGEECTAALQACLAAAGDGAAVRFAGSGAGRTVYRTNRTLRLAGRSGLTLRSDPGVRFHLESGRTNLFHATDCEDLALEDIDAFGEFEPSANHLHNKLLYAERCRGLRVERCRAHGLVLVRTHECERVEIARNECDTGVDAADFARGHAGFDYGVCLGASRCCIVRHNIIRNCVNDGVKFSGLRAGVGEERWSNLLYGEELTIEGNWITGCVNDDAIDIFNSGHRVIISGNVMIDNGKAINAKQESDPNAPVREIVISGNLMIGGRWNRDLNSLQCGVNLDTRHIVFTGNIVRDIVGLGIYFAQLTAEVIVSDSLIENIASSPQWTRETPLFKVYQPNGIGILDQTSEVSWPLNPTYNAGVEAPREKRDGSMIISNCMVRNCEGYGAILRHSARGGVDGCVFENIGRCGVWIDYFAGDPVPAMIRGCRFGTRDGAGPMAEAIRIGPTATGGAIVSQCVVYGDVQAPLVDETPGRRVRGSDNSWWPVSGPTADRPSGGHCPAGFAYYDVTVERQVFWTGSRWVDATGSPA